jgi:hypothetical protein
VVAVPDPTFVSQVVGTEYGSGCKTASLTLNWMNVKAQVIASYTSGLHWCWTETSSTTYVSSYYGCCISGGVYMPTWSYDRHDVATDYNDTACATYATNGHFSSDAFGITWQQWHPYISITGCVHGAVYFSYKA